MLSRLLFQVMTQAVISQSDGEMVKAVLNLDQLTQRNTESLQLDDKPSKDTPNQQVGSHSRLLIKLFYY